MKLLLLSDPNSPHTIKWARSLAENNIEVFIFGIGELSVNDYKNYNKIHIETLNNKIIKKEGSIKKIKYLKALPSLRSIIKKFKPNILHAHYASSYGILGALSGFHPFILSVWGSDVYTFPQKSFLHKEILKFNLRKSDKILSTSNIMATEIKKYTKKEIEITPFGVDIEHFKPMKVNSVFEEKDIVIGTVKSLEEKYGIEYLIKAFKIVYDKYPDLPLKLLIVGGGSLENNLKKKLTKDLNIDKNTIFTGKVPFNEVSKYQNILTISVTLSIFNSESFGVSVIEAMACEKPVIVSNIGGLSEVVIDNITGIIVPVKNPDKTAFAIEKLIFNENLRKKLGKAGREHVIKFYNWELSVKQMIDIYNDILTL